MKKNMTVIVIAFACCSLAFANKGDKETFDLFATTGYGIGIGGRDVGPTITTTNGSIVNKDDNFLNFGRGIKLEGGASYRLMDHLAGQASVCYNFGVPGIKQETITSIGAATNSLTQEYSFSTLGVKALLKPSFQVLDLIDVYTNFGIGLDFAFSSVQVTQNNTGVGEYHATIKDSNWPAIVFIGALGADYPLGTSMILYGEIYCESMSFMTSKQEISDSNFPTGTPYATKVINYEKDATDRSTPPETPGSNLGIRIGVRFPIF